mgnify:CR=1 FL=1
MKRVHKRIAAILTATMLASMSIAGCSDKTGGNGTTGGTDSNTSGEGREVLDIDLNQDSQSVTISEVPEQPEATEVPEIEESREGMVRSELTNEWIDESIADQRPIAVMVDNEKIALPHYGLTEADIVYEIVNSTKNDYVTRFMAIVKDWGSIEQFGSIRSARPTNFMIAAEYNAIICHDGGPFYIDNYLAKSYTNSLSGGFARFSNGKSTEFTEYITYNTYNNPTTGRSYSGLGQRIADAGYTTTYNSHFPGNHFQFSLYDTDLTEYKSSFECTYIDLPFPHNGSELRYNTETGKYDYYEYGSAHVDPLHNNLQLSFENVILQKCTYTQLDENGYLIYNVIDKGMDGYLIKNGHAVPIGWSKLAEDGLTVYSIAENGELVQLNTGKTYIALVPADKWNQLGLE